MKKTYQQQKEAAWDRILDMAWEMWDGETSRSYADIVEYQNRVLSVAKRFGLVRRCVAESVL